MATFTYKITTIYGGIMILILLSLGCHQAPRAAENHAPKDCLQIAREARTMAIAEYSLYQQACVQMGPVWQSLDMCMHGLTVRRIDASLECRDIESDAQHIQDFNDTNGQDVIAACMQDAQCRTWYSQQDPPPW